jgi:HEPN domain-containing protein
MDKYAILDKYIDLGYLSFVNRSFRDVADGDYIAARSLYKLELFPQFLWSAQQSIEKYLKSILLYNNQTAKEFLHDLEGILHKLNSITDITFDFPKDIKDFITYLNQQGNNRYFEKSAYTIGNELLMLDRTVWHIRRYCYYMRVQTNPGPDGQRIDLFPENIEYIKVFPVAKANRYRILYDGYIEEVLSQKSSPARKALVWKNFYYGLRTKRAIKYKAHSWSANPDHYLEPKLFSFLNERIKFSGNVKKLFQIP